MNNNQIIKKELLKLGQHIKYLRESRNLSLKDMAEKTGIRKEYLSKIENGTAYGLMINKHILQIVKVLNVSFYEIFNY